MLKCCFVKLVNVVVLDIMLEDDDDDDDDLELLELELCQCNLLIRKNFS
jgi:hypothetical protein